MERTEHYKESFLTRRLFQDAMLTMLVAELSGAVTAVIDGVLTGRFLGVTALGVDVADAVKNAYKAVGKITWEGVQYRKDIAHRALNR